MLGLLAFFGLVIGLVLVAVFFKVVFAILVWPLRALFWLLGGLFHLILLPFQLLGIAMLAIVAVPMLLIGLPIVLAMGIPVLLLAALLVPLLLLVGGLAVLRRLFAGH